MISKTIDFKASGNNYQPVNLVLMRDEKRVYYVQISTWHDSSDGDLIQVESIDFNDNRKLAESYIEDFSEDAAINFVESF